MKNLNSLISMVLNLALASCHTNKPVLVKDKAWEERCKGVTSLAWQQEIQGADAATSSKIITELTLKAKADAKQSENLKGEAALDASLKSEIAKAINENVSKNSQVSEGFWQQENTFGRLYCLSVSLLDRQDLSKTQKEQIVNDIREMQKAEATYALNKEKKSQ